MVYRADDLELGETVALKMIRESCVDDPAVLARFHEEIRLGRKIAQTNICRNYELLTDHFEGPAARFLHHGVFRRANPCGVAPFRLASERCGDPRRGFAELRRAWMPLTTSGLYTAT